jgi:chromosome segregation ATPase
MFFSEDKPVDRSFDSSQARTQHVKEFYEERLSSLAKQLQAYFAELDSDEIFKAMQENSLSREFAIQRASEVFSEVMRSEQEQTIHRQQNEIIEFKTLNMKLEYEKQRLSNMLSSFEEKCRNAENDRERAFHDLQIAKNRLEDLGYQLEESGKRKDFEWMQKLDMSIRKMEDKLQDSESKYLVTKKELDSSGQVRISNEYLSNELESLKKHLKNKEIAHFREIEEIRNECQVKVSELEKSCDSLSSQYKGFKKQSEDLAANQQSVIKNLVDKSKQLKQKIISQKNKLQDFSRISKESSSNLDAARSNYEKIILELEEKIRGTLKEALVKESELVAKHQAQVSQLQVHYQQMMNLKLTEMQQEVDEQVRKSKEHDREVKNLMDLKMKEIERDYLPRSFHEKVLLEKDSLINRLSSKLEDLHKENEKSGSDFQRLLIEHSKQNEDLIEKTRCLQDELLHEKERMGNDLNLKILKLKDSENSKIQLAKELEKSKKELKDLQANYEEEVQNRIKAENELINVKNDLVEVTSDLNQTRQTFKTAKTYHEQVLSDKVDKVDLLHASEKIEVYRKDLEKKNNFINNLQDEVKNLEITVRDLKMQKNNESKQLEQEVTRHLEAKSQLKELQGYSENLLMEIDYRDKKNLELRNQLDSLRTETNLLGKELEGKEKDLFSFKQMTITRDTESKARFRNSNEKIKKYVKNSSFFLKKQLGSLSEIVQHEYSSFNKFISTVVQEISIKIIELELKYRKIMDLNADQFGEDIRKHYKEKISQVEECMAQENFHWNDSETEGIRRAFKALIEKKHVSAIEIKSLKESLAKLTDQNENLYRENQKLQIRLHANNEAFDQLQREVTEEANKIKIRLETGKDRDMNRSPFYRNY